MKIRFLLIGVLCLGVGVAITLPKQLMAGSNPLFDNYSLLENRSNSIPNQSSYTGVSLLPNKPLANSPLEDANTNTKPEKPPAKNKSNEKPIISLLPSVLTKESLLKSDKSFFQEIYAQFVETNRNAVLTFALSPSCQTPSAEKYPDLAAAYLKGAKDAIFADTTSNTLPVVQKELKIHGVQPPCHEFASPENTTPPPPSDEDQQRLIAEKIANEIRTMENLNSNKTLLKQTLSEISSYANALLQCAYHHQSTSKHKANSASTSTLGTPDTPDCSDAKLHTWTNVTAKHYQAVLNQLLPQPIEEKMNTTLYQCCMKGFSVGMDFLAIKIDKGNPEDKGVAACQLAVAEGKRVKELGCAGKCEPPNSTLYLTWPNCFQIGMEKFRCEKVTPSCDAVANMQERIKLIEAFIGAENIKDYPNDAKQTR